MAFKRGAEKAKVLWGPGCLECREQGGDARCNLRLKIHVGARLCLTVDRTY